MTDVRRGRAEGFQAMGIQADPAAAAILAQVPSAVRINNFNTGDSTATLLRNSAGYQFLKRDNRTRDNVTFKSDYLPSTRHSFTVSYIFNRDILDRPDLDTTFNLIPSIANNDPSQASIERLVMESEAEPYQ
jgi:hypothetical protein